MNIPLVFGQIPGLPIPPFPPGFLWFTLSVGGLVFGISKLIESAGRHSREDPKRSAKPLYSSQPPSEDIEAKLRKLASLKDQNLISEEEHQRKRQDIIAKW
jgi:hypothetical protein